MLTIPARRPRARCASVVSLAHCGLAGQPPAVCVVATPAVRALSSHVVVWWGRGDSNSYALRHVILNHARLPIPTLPHAWPPQRHLKCNAGTSPHHHSLHVIHPLQACKLPTNRLPITLRHPPPPRCKAPRRATTPHAPPQRTQCNAAHHGAPLPGQLGADDSKGESWLMQRLRRPDAQLRRTHAPSHADFQRLVPRGQCHSERSEESTTAATTAPLAARSDANRRSPPNHRTPARTRTQSRQNRSRPGGGRPTTATTAGRCEPIPLTSPADAPPNARTSPPCSAATHPAGANNSAPP